MYYYISEAPSSAEERRTIERVRAHLTQLGIAGEFVTASPARTVEELAELGAAKKYSTIVAMGSERLINQVGTLLAGTPYVFGALPIDRPAALELVTGISTLEEAAQALKYRRVRTYPVMRIEPNKYFVTEVVIRLTRAVPVVITVDGSRIETMLSDLRLAGTGQLLLLNQYQDGGRVAQWLKWVTGSKDRRAFDSRFFGHQITLETKDTLPVYLGRDVLAKTPLAATLIPNSLKLITKRDRVAATNQDTLVSHPHTETTAMAEVATSGRSHR